MSLSLASKVIVLLILFYELCASDAEVLDYTDIETLGMSCFPKDSCDRTIELSFGNRSCECDNACNDFDDCCINAPSRRQIPEDSDTGSGTNFGCLAYESALGAYAIMSCPTDYEDREEVRSKCEHVEDTNDPLAAAPVTDIAFNITYKNHYCAQCHNAEPVNLLPWDISIACDTLPRFNGTFLVNATYVEEHFKFNNNSSSSSNGEWGFYYPDDEQSDESNFYACYFPFRPSDSLSPFLRLCRDDIISTCPQSYRRSRIIKACKSYRALVEVAGKIYKNPHCAMCNSENIRDANRQTMCTIAQPNILQREKREGLSFAVLMDVNRSDGDRVGLVQDDRCPGTERYDPFAKKCRRSLCAIPSWRIELGKCVPP